MKALKDILLGASVWYTSIIMAKSQGREGHRIEASLYCKGKSCLKNKEDIWFGSMRGSLSFEWGRKIETEPVFIIWLWHACAAAWEGRGVKYAWRKHKDRSPIMGWVRIFCCPIPWLTGPECDQLDFHSPSKLESEERSLQIVGVSAHVWAWSPSFSTHVLGL